MNQERSQSKSTKTPDEWIRILCDLARQTIDPERVARSKQRHGAVFRWEEADSIPLMYGAPVPELEGLELPSYDWTEQYNEPAKSFVHQIQGVLRAARSGSDALPSVRADTGVVNGPSVFGAEFAVPAHTKPVVTKYVPKEALVDVELPDDIRGLGTMPKVIEHTQHHQEVIRREGLDHVMTVHHCDTQGPFDIAEQTRGHELLTDFYEDPEFVHHLMREATKAYIAISHLCKGLAGEGTQWGNAVGHWMEPGGVRMCDDSGILVSPEIFGEFIQPYQVDGFAPFGGGWLHYCGGVPEGGRAEGLHIHDLYLANPYLRGLNFTTGKDLSAEIRKILAADVNYIGGFPRNEGEALADYFRRILSLCPGRKGLFLQPSLQPGEAEGAMDTWMQVQDDVFGTVRGAGMPATTAVGA